tara:strand:- start:72 stop:533 length:462 start_codon:yes stop_codon:yes gene_type:complete
MAEVVMVIGAVVGAVSSVNSMNTAKKSAAAQQKASNTQIQMQRTKATRERRQSIRANIAARARMRNQAELTGVAGSSGAEGGASSVSSQGGANLGFSSQMSGLGQQFTAFSGQAASLASKSQSQAAMGSLGFQAYSFGSSVKDKGGFKKAFTA